MTAANGRRPALEKRLDEHGLEAADVVDADGIRRLAGIEHLRHQSLRSLSITLGLGPMPKALFAVGNRSYWSYDEIMGWLAPFLASDRPAVSREALREEALRRYAAGDDEESIAADSGIAAANVTNWARAAGVYRPKGPRGRPRAQRGPKVALAIDLYVAGMNSWKASRLAGMSDQEFRCAVRDAGHEVRSIGRPVGYRAHPAEERRLGVALHRRGRSINSIAEELGVDWRTVRRWVDDEANDPRCQPS